MFKNNTLYKCKHDFIVDKELAFKKDSTYKCLNDTIIGCNNKPYSIDLLYELSPIGVEYYFEEYSELKQDNVNHPTHYCSHPSGIECIEITQYYDFCIGCAIKYLWRNGLKTEKGVSNKEKQIEDLKKAIWYINKEIEILEKS